MLSFRSQFSWRDSHLSRQIHPHTSVRCQLNMFFSQFMKFSETGMFDTIIELRDMSPLDGLSFQLQNKCKI